MFTDSRGLLSFVEFGLKREQIAPCFTFSGRGTQQEGGVIGGKRRHRTLETLRGQLEPAAAQPGDPLGSPEEGACRRAAAEDDGLGRKKGDMAPDKGEA